MFSWIHILSLVSIGSITIAVWAIRNGNIKQHGGVMMGAFSGAIIAGFFATIIPGRIVHTFLFDGG